MPTWPGPVWPGRKWKKTRSEAGEARRRALHLFEESNRAEAEALTYQAGEDGR